MTDREALLAALLANPEDDTCRLAFADWYDENGLHLRAEFIRLQCKLVWMRKQVAALQKAKGGGRPTSKNPPPRDIVRWNGRRVSDRQFSKMETAHELYRREWELLKHFGSDWAEPIPSRILSGSCTWKYSRGFVYFVRCDSAEWISSGDSIRKSQPIEVVQLADRPRVLRSTARNYLWYFAGDDRYIEWVGPAGSEIGRSVQIDELLRKRWPKVLFSFPEEAGILT